MLEEKKRKKKSGALRRFLKNKLSVIGMVVIVAFVLIAIFADQLAPYDYAAQDLTSMYLSPCAEHLLGTDNLGRDMLSRIIYGTRISLLIGFSSVGIASIPSYARIVRASIFSIRDQEYIEAARISGCSDARMILRHILPNILAPVIVQTTLGLGLAILNASGLSFLGLGVEAPMPEKRVLRLAFCVCFLHRREGF